MICFHLRILGVMSTAYMICHKCVIFSPFLTEANRNDLVSKGAIPALIQALQSTDHDIQYYCSAALSNIAIDEKHRTMMVAVGCHDIVEAMIRLLTSKSERVKCQACFALRNLASDGRLLI